MTGQTPVHFSPLLVRCRSEPARKRAESVKKDAGCTTAIAGKPGSHRFCDVRRMGDQHTSSVGASLLAKAVCQAMRCRVYRRPREQARSHRICGVHRMDDQHRSIVGVSLLAKAVYQAMRCRVYRRLREQARSHRICGVHRMGDQHRSSVGASLLAKAVCQAMRCRLYRRLREQARSHRFSGCTAISGIQRPRKGKSAGSNCSPVSIRTPRKIAVCRSDSYSGRAQ